MRSPSQLLCPSMMKNVWLGCLASFLSLTVGSVLLLLFMNFYTVPHVLTSMFQVTSCKLISVCPLQRSHPLLREHSTQRSGASRAGSLILETQWQENTSYSHIQNSVEPYKEDICHQISSYKAHMNRNLTAGEEEVTDCPYIFAVEHNDQIQPLIEDSWTYYMYTVNKSKCHCPSCWLQHLPDDDHHAPSAGTHSAASSPRLSVGGSGVALGRPFPCHVNGQATGEIVWRRNSTFVILNVMLWPTLLFIFGFVGAFFSWLNLQYERFSICRLSS